CFCAINSISHCGVRRLRGSDRVLLVWMTGICLELRKLTRYEARDDPPLTSCGILAHFSGRSVKLARVRSGLAHPTDHTLSYGTRIRHLHTAQQHVDAQQR